MTAIRAVTFIWDRTGIRHSINSTSSSEADPQPFEKATVCCHGFTWIYLDRAPILRVKARTSHMFPTKGEPETSESWHSCTACVLIYTCTGDLLAIPWTQLVLIAAYSGVASVFAHKLDIY